MRVIPDWLFEPLFELVENCRAGGEEKRDELLRRILAAETEEESFTAWQDFLESQSGDTVKRLAVKIFVDCPHEKVRAATLTVITKDHPKTPIIPPVP